MRILRNYILRQHLVPFLLGFGVVTFILEMDVMFDYLDLIVNRGVAPNVVGQLYLLSLGYIVALSVPCAVLVAVLMTFGRLSQDNEITALRASGVNLASVLTGPLLASLVVAGGLTVFNNYVLPETNHAFAGLLVDISRMRPTVKLQEGVFVNDFPGYNLLVQRVNGRTNEMRGITIYQTNPNGPPTTILAKKGTLSYLPGGGTAMLSLQDGEIHEIPSEDLREGVRKYRRLKFKTHVLYIAGAGGMLERTIGSTRSDREMSAASLLVERAKFQEQYQREREHRLERLEALGLTEDDFRRFAPDRPAWLNAIMNAVRWIGRRRDPFEQLGERTAAIRNEIEMWAIERDALMRRMATLSVEIHKKFSLPAACVVFVLVGAPIGMRVRRAGPAVAFVSVLFFLFYYMCLVGGEELANRLLLPPWLAMWLANLVIGWFGIRWTLEACELWMPQRRALPGTPMAR
jgi:lipopolysaccharide export system permease protein